MSFLLQIPCLDDDDDEMVVVVVAVVVVVMVVFIILCDGNCYELVISAFVYDVCVCVCVCVCVYNLTSQSVFISSSVCVLNRPASYP